jgi:hypothetical protein
MALRSTLAGLLSLAAAEELILLAATVYRPASDGGSDGGRPDRWAAVPLVAHNNHFKRQQAERLAALAAGQVPATYGDVDHSSAEVYRGYAAQPAAGVMSECRRVSADLIDRMWVLPDEDLLDPARHPWLNGRLLWLQIIVRAWAHGALTPGRARGPRWRSSLACVGIRRRKEFCVSCHQLCPRARHRHADWQLR